MNIISYCNNLFQQKPTERKLGRRIIVTRKNGRPHFKRTWASTYEISLLASLKQLLSDSFILDEVCVCFISVRML